MKSTEIIVEIAQAHEGSLGILHSYIDAVAETGANTIKFQMHIAEAESSIHEPFRVKFSYVDKTRFDYWKRMSFSAEQWEGIKKHCEEKKLEFLCSPFSIEAVDLLEKLNVKRYKIASGEMENYLMFERISTTRKPVLLSSGMSSYHELERAINFFKSKGIDVSIFQCTTSYPTKAAEIGLNIITEMITRFNLPVGLSDHSGEIYASLAAVSLGAQLIEVHAVYDKRMFGPDASSSLTIDQIKTLVKGIRYIDEANSSIVKKDSSSKFTEQRRIFGKSLATRKEFKKGEIITFEDLESKKPAGMGISASDFNRVLNKRVKRDISKYDFLTDSDIEN